MPDPDSAILPTAYEGLARLQLEFDIYQKAAFPVRGPNFFALELNGEAGELANLEKKVWKGLEIEAERFANEAADVLIALLNYANARNVDLAKAVETKMKLIDERRRK
jgi:NTP pyrophosphatase (non-canonical NTP hydrolase)